MVLVYAMVILTEVDVYLIASCMRVPNIICIAYYILAHFGNLCSRLMMLGLSPHGALRALHDGFGKFLVSHERLSRMKMIG